MFWSRKKKNNDKKKTKKSEQVLRSGGDKDQGLSSEEIRAQALANARAARQQIGEEALQKIAEAMTKKQQSKIEQAKMQIAEADAERVLDELMSMMNETRH